MSKCLVGRKKREKPVMAKVKVTQPPKVGDDIYVPTALHLSRGSDDVMGGLAKVVSVGVEMSGGEQVHFVSVEEVPGFFNWEQGLASKQKELKKRFGKNRAHPDPDDHPSANRW